MYGIIASMRDSSKFIFGRPLSGGLIHFQIRLTRLSRWLGPLWSALCGVLAAGNFDPRSDDWLRLAVLLLLVDGGWGTLWSALSTTDWAASVDQWRHWHTGHRISTLPYTKAGAPGYRLAQALGTFRSWWRTVLWPQCGSAISSALVALFLTGIFSLLLGPTAFILTIAALATVQLGVAWEGGSGRVIPEWDSVIAIALPWIAGQSAFGAITLSSSALAFCLALAFGTAWRVTNPWGVAAHIFSQVLSPTLLIAMGHPVAAAAYAIVLAPQFALLPLVKKSQYAGWYVKHTRWWLFTSMLLVAVAL